MVHMQTDESQSADVSHWRRLVLSQLNVLLNNASPTYSSLDIRDQLEFVSRRLIESNVFSSRPTSSTAWWKSNLSDDYSPVEYSLSIKKEACIVRLAFEPIGDESDPVNYVAPNRWLLDNKYEYDDVSWYNVLSRILCINPSAHNYHSLSPAACGLTQHLFGLDLHNGKHPLLKMYIFPDAVTRQNSKSEADYAHEKMRVLTTAMAAIDLSTPWNKVAKYLDYLREADPEFSGEPEFIGWDALDPRSARMKVYVRFSKVTLKDLLSHLDLGGRLKTKHTVEIQHAADELWKVFSGEDDQQLDIASNDLQDCGQRTRGVIMYYELRKGEPNPKAKCASICFIQVSCFTDAVLTLQSISLCATTSLPI